MKIFAVFLGIRIHGVKNFTEAGVNPAITQLLVTYFFLNNTTYKFYIIFQKMDLSQNIGDKNFLYEICEKQFSSDYDKKRHMKCVYGEEKLFECNVCNKKFGQKKEMNNHVANIHQEKHHNCKSCGKIFCFA